MSEVAAKRYPCPSCGAKLEFAPGASLKCPYCGHETSVPKSGEEIKELDFQEYLSQASAKEEVIENQTVKCNSCGAEQTVDPNITMSHCAFCGLQLMAQAKTTRTIKPKSLLPFKINKSQAMDQYRGWLKGLWFAPSQLKQYAQTEGALKGVYIPYWTYNANTFTWYQGQRGDDYQETEYYTEKDDQGNEQTKSRVVTRTEWTPVSGFVANDFTNLLVLASWSLPREKTERLEPWDLENLEPYRDEFISGFQAEAYQVDLGQGFENAKRIMQGPIEDNIRHDIGGDHQKIDTSKTQYNNITFKHILLPIWINAYRYQNKSYRFVVNGRTGEVQGERPWSYLKIALTVAGVLVAGGLIYYLVRLFH
ncbi:MAG: hypothetical protein AB1641_07720 [Thermodesulfobacteriota bacterium]